jgi:hypothetical protein
MSANGNEGKMRVDSMVVTTSAEDDFCQYCDTRPAEIFQVTGQYCLECWQELTHPEV